jgi:PAS domain S-box-containing protein
MKMSKRDKNKIFKDPVDDTHNLGQGAERRRAGEKEETVEVSSALNVGTIVDERTDKLILDTIFANIHFLVAYMDVDFNFVQVNNAYARAGGHPPEFFVGKNHFDLYPNKENEVIFREVMKTGKAYHAYEKPFTYPVQAEKRITYWDWSAHRIKGKDETVQGLILCLVDVTERRQTKEELEEIQETFHLVTESMDDVFWMSTPGMEKMIYINPAYERVWGKTRKSLYEAPKSFLNDIHPGDKDMVSAGLQEHEKVEWSFEYRIVRADGSIRWIHNRGFPLWNEQRQLKLIAGMASDITERKAMEEEISQYVEELERSNKELEDFAYVSSHDLQEPLRKIQTFSGRLADKFIDKLGEDGRDYLERMNRAATRMRRLLDALLTYSRITTKASPFDPVRIEEIIREAVSNLGGLIEKTGGSVNAEGISLCIEADPIQMLQLLQNLIGNGLKFHRPDVPPVVRIDAQLVQASRKHAGVRPVSPKTCRIMVTDNGIGFDAKYLDRVFEPFQRLRGRFEYEGTGMGLAICRKIVERHEGDITAKSNPGEGSTFIVTLPLKQAKGKAQDL